MDVVAAQTEHFTNDEVSGLLRNMSDADRVRVASMSVRLAVSGLSADDLRQEAYRRMLEVEAPRFWPRDVAFATFMFNTMKSIRSAFLKSARRREEVNEADGDVKLVDRPEAASPSFETDILGDEKAGQIRNAVLATFKDHEVAFMVMEGKMAGLKGQDLCELADITKDELATVNKLIQRRMKQSFPDGWQHNA